MLFEDHFAYLMIKVLLVVIGTLGMMCSVSEFKYSVKKVLRLIALYLLYVFLSSALIVRCWGYLFLLRIFLLTISAPATILIHRMSKNNPAQAVFNYVSQILFSLYLSASITLLNTAIRGSKLSDLLLRFLSYALVIALEYFLLRRPSLRLTANLEQGWGILSLIPCALILLITTIAFYPEHYTKNPNGVMMVYLTGAVVIIIYFSIFQYLSMQQHLQKVNQDRKLLELQVNVLTSRIKDILSAAEAARIERHDSRHRLQTIASLLEQNDVEEAKKYIGKVMSFSLKQEISHWCSEPILDATLSCYFNQIKAEDIRLETSLSFPNKLPVEAADLSIVFANALENAFNACLELPKKDRKIICRCIHEPALMLEISNPYFGKVLLSEESVPICNKADHGIGVRSIVAFCKKYGGYYHFDAKDGWFTLRILLSGSCRPINS